MLKELKREHRITYLALDDGSSGRDAGERAEEYCHELITVPHHTRAKFTPGFYLQLLGNLLSPLPYFIMKYRSQGMRNEIERLAVTGAFDVVVCDFLQPSVNLPNSLALPTILFQHNVEAMIWKRHYEVQRDPFKKLYLYGQWRKALAFEGKMCRRFDRVVAVSREDCETMRVEYGIDHAAAIPTGVDTNYFQPSGKEDTEPYNLVFTGSMDWLPNDDAIKFFVGEILPLIKRQLPQVTLTVVGRDPYPEMLVMGERDSAIIVTGRVDDVRPYIERAAAYIVPIRIGGGTRLKIYEAMAMEKPVISTTIGAEGLPVNNSCQLLLADSPVEFAEAVVFVLKNESFARQLAARGAQLVREQFGWYKAAGAFAEICSGATRGRTAPGLHPKKSLQPVS